MSSLRLADIEILSKKEGICRLCCDWHKGDTFTTFVLFEVAPNRWEADKQKRHHTLSSSLARLASLAKAAGA